MVVVHCYLFCTRWFHLRLLLHNCWLYLLATFCESAVVSAELSTSKTSSMMMDISDKLILVWSSSSLIASGTLCYQVTGQGSPGSPLKWSKHPIRSHLLHLKFLKVNYKLAEIHSEYNYPYHWKFQHAASLDNKIPNINTWKHSS